MKKNILIISPFPPPITGVSLASEKIVNALSGKYNFKKLDFSKKNLSIPSFSLSHAIHIFKIVWTLIRKRRNYDMIYMAISQSLLGNLKDLLFIYILRRNKIILHLHGGGMKKVLFDRYPFIHWLNMRILSYVEKIIVLSPSLRLIFQSIVPEGVIETIPNFFESYFLISGSDLEKKYNTEKKIILYFSNMIAGKGYSELLDAFLSSEDRIREKYELHFAGSFDTDGHKSLFLKKIDGHSNIYYHGIVKGPDRIELYKEAHLFCLPSYYPYLEGQPISIIEAYASGCIVVSTDHGGIKDIFSPTRNGFLVEKQSVGSISSALKKFDDLSIQAQLDIGTFNRDQAENLYNENLFIDRINSLFSLVLEKD